MLLIYLNMIDTPEEKDRFEYIYTKFKKQMLYSAKEIVGNSYDAEDIVHNTFLSIAKNIHIFDNRSDRSIYSYLICATKGHALNYLRKKNNEEKALSRIYNEPSADLSSLTLDNKIDYKTLLESIRNLDELYADVLYLYYVEELTYKEVAALLGRKPATVRKQIERGKDLLYFDLKMKGFEI